MSQQDKNTTINATLRNIFIAAIAVSAPEGDEQVRPFILFTRVYIYIGMREKSPT